MEAGDQAQFGSTWYSSVEPLPPPRIALNYDLDVDVCVIGGGLAGLTVAREVVRRQWSVALLEAKRVGWNASGRSSGFVLPGFPSGIEKIVERVGLATAKALWTVSEMGVQYVRDMVAALGPAGIMVGEGWLDVSKTPDTGAALARLSLLGQEIGAEVEGWSKERVRAALKTSHYFHAIHYPRAFHISPLAYMLRLADATERAGAYIFENTPAIAIDPAGIRKRVATPQGRVRAGHIVLAGNIFHGGVAQRLSDTLLPITAYTGVTKPLGANLAAAVAYSGAVSDSHYGSHHYRIAGGDRLQWTGGATVTPRRHSWMKWKLERALGAIYPQLGPIEFDSFWSGQMGLAIHGMPQIGEVQPGVWLASGFGNRGIGVSAIAGDLIARGMVEGDDAWRVFLPYELVWAGGRTGRVVAQATLGWWQRREALTALIARQREELRRKRLEEARRPRNALPPAAEVPNPPPRPAYRTVEIPHHEPERLDAQATPSAAAELPAPASTTGGPPAASTAGTEAVASLHVPTPEETSAK